MVKIIMALLFIWPLTSLSQVKTFDEMVGYKNLPEVDSGKIRVVDSRADKKNLGVVQVGAYNKKFPVLNDAPLDSIMQKLIGSKIQDELTGRSILLNIRLFNFAETTKSMKEYGYVRFRAELYQTFPEYFTELGTIDTLITISFIDVTNKMMKESFKVIENWVRTSINIAPDTTKKISLTTIKKRDDIEKREMPLYRGKPLINGIYQTYEELVNVEPGITKVEISYNAESKKMLAKMPESNQIKFLTSKQGYAVVYNNALFILTPEGVSQAYPKDGFIHFKAKYNRDYSKEIDNTPITYKIDHLNGAWLPVSER